MGQAAFKLDMPEELPLQPPQQGAAYAPAPEKLQEEKFQEEELQQDEHQESDDEQPARVLKRGRPRSQKSRSAILRATNALLNHMSVQELSIEGIAKKAKVGKTTIYRWWPNKTAIVMDAIASQPGVQEDIATPSSNAEALALQLDKLIRLLRSKNGETISQLFSEAQADRKSQEIFANTFLSPLIDAIEFSIEQGQAAGEFRADMDMRMAVDVLCGPIFFRLMAHPDDFNAAFQEHYPADAVRLIAA